MIIVTIIIGMLGLGLFLAIYFLKQIMDEDD